MLGIETSCDDSGVAILDFSGQVLGEALASQWAVHQEYGGVVPNLAMRAHEMNLPLVLDKALAESGKSLKDLNAIAVTVGPGLEPCLRIGIRTAKQIALQHNIPLMPVNHLEAHALSARIPPHCIEFPFLVLLLSGGHSQILLCKGVGQYHQLGGTSDDSLGECYDKVFRILAESAAPSLDNFSRKIHAGQALEELARAGDASAYSIPVPLRDARTCNFSFAGLKSAMTSLIEKEKPLTQKKMEDLAASFQYTALQHVLTSLYRAIQMSKLLSPTTRLVFAGGVARNQYFRHGIEQLAREDGYQVWYPEQRLCTDNGVMVAWAAVERIHAGLPFHSDPSSLDSDSRLPLDQHAPAAVTKIRGRRVYGRAVF